MFNDDKNIQSFLEGSKPFDDQYFEGSENACKHFSPYTKKALDLGAKKSKVTRSLDILFFSRNYMIGMMKLFKGKGEEKVELLENMKE